MNQPPLPLVIEPQTAGESLVEHTRARRAAIDEALLVHGALLFRGFFEKDTPGAEFFDWIAAHGRNPYIGERRLLVTLGEPIRYGADLVVAEMDSGVI